MASDLLGSFHSMNTIKQYILGWILFAVAIGPAVQGRSLVWPKTPQQTQEDAALRCLDLSDSVVLFCSNLFSQKLMRLDRQIGQASCAGCLLNARKVHIRLLTASGLLTKGLPGSMTTLVSLHSLLTV
jgi:hypothetical protein